jgi:replicative DNA helicase
MPIINARPKEVSPHVLRDGRDAARFAAGHTGGGLPPPVWPAGDPVVAHIEIAPSRIVLVGGPPGGGKTALLGQWSIGLLSHNSDLRVLNANVEMPADMLLVRQLSRLSGIPLTAIQRHQIQPGDIRRLDAAAKVLRSVAARLAFATEPHRLEAIAMAGTTFGADLIILDYLQRIAPSGKSSGLRERINLLMTELRLLADKGRRGILAAAAVSRSRDGGGRATYDGRHLTMASFRESGELEFACDDCLILHPAEGDDPAAPVRSMLLKHEKSRYGETREVALNFHRQTQRFELDPFYNFAATYGAAGHRNGFQEHGKT